MGSVGLKLFAADRQSGLSSGKACRSSLAFLVLAALDACSRKSSGLAEKAKPRAGRCNNLHCSDLSPVLEVLIAHWEYPKCSDCLAILFTMNPH